MQLDMIQWSTSIMINLTVHRISRHHVWFCTFRLSVIDIFDYRIYLFVWIMNHHHDLFERLLYSLSSGEAPAPSHITIRYNISVMIHHRLRFTDHSIFFSPCLTVHVSKMTLSTVLTDHTSAVSDVVCIYLKFRRTSSRSIQSRSYGCNRRRGSNRWSCRCRKIREAGRTNCI